MAENSGKTVAEILKNKNGSVVRAPLKPGSPSWDEIMHLTWEEVVEKAKRNERGFRTFRKLLSDPEYNK